MMAFFDFKNSANKYFQKWKNYRLTDWFSVTIGGVIFIVGYFLGAVSWRKGASPLFIGLDFVSGSAGFVYCLYKSLKVVSETYEEYLAAILEEHSQNTQKKPNIAAENDYVLGEMVFSNVQGATAHDPTDTDFNFQTYQTDNNIKSLEELSPFSYTLVTGKIKEPKSEEIETFDCSSVKQNNINLEMYANFPIATEFNAIKSNDINPKIRSPNISSSESIDQINFLRSPTPGIQSFLGEFGESHTDGSETKVSAEASQKLYFAIQNTLKERSNEQIPNTINYHNTDLNCFQQELQWDQKGQKASYMHSSQRPLERFKSVSEHFLNAPPQNRDFPREQRIVHSFTTDNLHYREHEDMNHYKKPRSMSFLFDSTSLESPTIPDPCRHLKPISKITKSLPDEPEQNLLTSNSDASKGPVIQQFRSPPVLPPPRRQFQTPTQPVQQFKSPDSNTSYFQSPVQQKSLFSSSRQFNSFHSPVTSARRLSPGLKDRKCEPLTRHQSYPINLRSRSSPTEPRYFTPVSKLTRGKYLARQQSNPILLKSQDFKEETQFLSPDSNVGCKKLATRYTPKSLTLGSRSPPLVVQSPPPRSRPSPPFGASNVPQQRSKKSPPTIPRKVGSYR